LALLQSDKKTMLTDKNNNVMIEILKALDTNANKDVGLINHIKDRLNDIKDEDLKLQESLKILKELREN
jgi:hypothetical protein